MKKNTGFTLLEAIIALAILVIGLSAILPLFAVGATSHNAPADNSPDLQRSA